MTHHSLDSEVVHHAWDNSLSPRLVVESGDSVTFSTRGGEDKGLDTESDHEAVVARPFTGHALTGPVAVEGALPGDVLEVELIELCPGDWGYTLIAPGAGLLPEEFPDPYLAIWDLADGEVARWEDLEVPIEPFHGCLGVAPAEPGEHSTIPPRNVGGNLDIKQLQAGCVLWLPVEVPSALFSCGDGHAAQGDGEICTTAIETGMTSTLRLSLRRDMSVATPSFETPGPLVPRADRGPWHVVTGIGEDPRAAVREAARAAIAYVERRLGCRREQAYVVASVAADFRLAEVVNGSWVVTGMIPLSIVSR